MATTKIWSIKHDLDHSISYIMNNEKTMNGNELHPAHGL